MITVESTPNPNALKFITSRDVTGSREPKFYKKESFTEIAEDVPVLDSLFEISGVTDVFFGSNFITVGKDPSVEWPLLKQPVIQVIDDYDKSGHQYFIETPKPACENINSDAGTSKVEKQIKHLLDERVRPAVAQDGGDIIFHSFEDGVVYLEMFGACSGCPSSTATLKMGIENMLRHYIPEVKGVQAV